jgi:uncharacterized BrkB/YihY/UPF0761 family membrane protein
MANVPMLIELKKGEGDTWFYPGDKTPTEKKSALFWLIIITGVIAFILIGGSFISVISTAWSALFGGTLGTRIPTWIGIIIVAFMAWLFIGPKRKDTDIYQY